MTENSSYWINRMNDINKLNKQFKIQIQLINKSFLPSAIIIIEFIHYFPYFIF